MSATYHYKSKVPVVLRAVKAFMDKRNVIVRAGFDFAHMFGKSEDVQAFFSDRPRFEFVGIAWVNGKEPENPLLWTKPLADGRRFPKKTGGDEEGRLLRAKWHEHYPKDHVDHSEILATINCPMDTFWQTPGVALGEGIVWFNTTYPATAHVTEVTTSQWNKATSELMEKQNEQ